MSQLNRLEQEQALVAQATKEIREYVEALVDDASFVETNAFSVGQSRIDGAPIVGEGVLCGTATMWGQPIVVVAQNVDALYGSMGKATADKICRAFDLALRRNIPVLSVLDSMGARVGEGVAMLEGYGAVLKKASDFYMQNGLHLCVIKGQASGLAAAYAAIADFRLMDKGGILSVAAPAVIAARAAGTFDVAASAEANLAAGEADFVCDDLASVKAALDDLWNWYACNYETADDPNRETPALDEGYTLDALMAALVDDNDYLEFRASVGAAAKCYLAHVNDISVGVVACDYAACATLSTADAEKVLDFLVVLSRAGATLITLVDSDGLSDEEHKGLIEDMAGIATYMADEDINRIAVCVGHAVGAAYTLLASKGIGFDYSVAFPDAVIAPIAPTAAVHLAYADILKEKGNGQDVQDALAAAYARDKGDAFDAAAKGYIDEVIAPSTLRPYVANALLLLGADE